MAPGSHHTSYCPHTHAISKPFVHPSAYRYTHSFPVTYSCSDGYASSHALPLPYSCGRSSHFTSAHSFTDPNSEANFHETSPYGFSHTHFTGPFGGFNIPLQNWLRGFRDNVPDVAIPYSMVGLPLSPRFIKRVLGKSLLVLKFCWFWL